ncbi:MAG: DUF1800 family protein [Betaproteobacteria bacterium]|nr:DUF1800 family protein [Betaproteobacteria bacterium]
MPAEAAGIDAGGAGPGWVRTSGRFSAFKNADDDDGLLAVCRFYGSTAIDPATGLRRGPNSHFYTSNAAECEQVKQDPGWTYEGIAFHIHDRTGTACAAATQPVYRSYNNGYLANDSNHRYTTDLTVQEKMPGQGYSPEGIVMCAPMSAAQADADIVRLLEQATFGPTDASLAHARAVGTSAFIEEQLAAPASKYPVFPFFPFNRPDTCVNANAPPYTADSFCARDNYTLFQLQRQFYMQGAAAADQLRQRVAFALSQIFVISGVEGGLNQPYGMAEYQQILRDYAFDNFENILTRVTLHPTMGRYLDMANNNKTTNGVQPNENFAREILQLFSIGLVELNQDGTPILDAAGKPVPTYDQAEIDGFANAFTGWSYPPQPGQTARFNNTPYFSGQMVSFSANHETAAKQLLGATAPAGLSPTADLANAIHNIFLHPNVGPFIGTQLIQKLVTGSPTPGYVGRVAAAFEDNGAGVRGDMKAVVRAILADPEARGDLKLDPVYGKLREPALYMLNILRAFNGQTDGTFMERVGTGLLQPVFYSPSVFNYYPPDYIVPNTNALGPEFAIQNTSTALSRMNTVNTLVFSTLIAPDPTVIGATGTSLSMAALQALAADPAQMVAKLDALLLHGTMSAQMGSAIIAAVNVIPASDTLNRARTAAYLVTTSSQYQVQR